MGAGRCRCARSQSQCGARYLSEGERSVEGQALHTPTPDPRPPSFSHSLRGPLRRLAWVTASVLIHYGRCFIFVLPFQHAHIWLICPSLDCSSLSDRSVSVRIPPLTSPAGPKLHQFQPSFLNESFVLQHTLQGVKLLFGLTD